MILSHEPCAPKIRRVRVNGKVTHSSHGGRFRLFFMLHTQEHFLILEKHAYINRRQCWDWPCWIVRIYASDFATLKSFWLQSDWRYRALLSASHCRWNKSSLADGWVLSHSLMALKLCRFSLINTSAYIAILNAKMLEIMSPWYLLFLKCVNNILTLKLYSVIYENC